MADVRMDLNKTLNDLSKVAEDAAYVAIGLGVMGVQRAQVRRRELQTLFESQIARGRANSEIPASDVRQEISKALKELDKTFGEVIERFDANLDPVSERLPAGAQALVHQAKEARDQLRGYLTSLAA